MSIQSTVAGSVVISEDRGVERRETIPIEGWVIVYEYYPDLNSDYYASRNVIEFQRVLADAGIISHSCPIRQQRTYVGVGSGPGGRPRFGDKMMPTIQRLFVEPSNVGAANAAMAKHKEAVKLWLDYKGPMPEVCRW